jgi:hypothetical protein
MKLKEETDNNEKDKEDGNNKGELKFFLMV